MTDAAGYRSPAAITVTRGRRPRAHEPPPEALAVALRGRECEHDGGSFEEARALYREALRIDPDFGGAKACLGWLYLAHGNYARAWPLLEHRDLPHQENAPPRWRGEALHGKTLAVTMEVGPGGAGDSIQFARFVPLLRSRGGRTVLMCAGELGRLYQTLAVDEVYSVALTPRPFAATHNVGIPWKPDCYTELCSIPHIFDVRPHSVPQPPYLRADPADIERYRPWIPQTGLRVGLVWRGGVTNSYDRWRSLPALSALAPILRVPGVSFVSLQVGAGQDEAAAAHASGSLVNLGSEVKDFADTAAVLAQLDLLVSVDTSTAHLAGALGKPVWMLLDKVPDWRWRDPDLAWRWYPSARLFYQRTSGDWSAPIEAAAGALRELVAARERPA